MGNGGGSAALSTFTVQPVSSIWPVGNCALTVPSGRGWTTPVI